MKTLALHLVSLLLSGSFAVNCLQQMKEVRISSPNTDQDSEVLYLPTGKGLDLISLGFRNALANFLWFNTISYFGRHYASDHNYKWLGHMCNIITTLDPGMKHVFEFGSLMLAWEVQDPQAANKLLSKAISHHPDDWKFYYLRGFNSLYYLNKPLWAQRDFQKSSTLPGAHVLIKLLAAKTLIKEENDPASAVRFLTSMLEQAQQPYEKKVLQERLQEARLALELSILKQAVSIFESRHGRKPQKIEELVESGIVANLSGDPYGGSYYLDPQSGEPLNTGKKTRGGGE